MKVILCLCIVAISGYIGYSISKFYIQRKKFFQCLLNFSNGLKTDINFTSKKLDTILGNVSYGCKDFNTLIANYEGLLNATKDFNGDQLFENITILNEDEKSDIFQFFVKLGKLDVFNQVESIEAFKNVSERYLLDASAESKKYSALYIKLGIIIGAFISLIII